MKTIVVWYRNDLRVHDHPALARAITDADRVVPLFIFDPAIYAGKHASANRIRFLLECLHDLKSSLQKNGGNLVIRNGTSSTELKAVVQEVGASAVYYTADYSPFAVNRDKKIQDMFDGSKVEMRAFAGRLIVSSVTKITTKTGTPHKVFTPFWRAWQLVERRELARSSETFSFPTNISIGAVPRLEELINEENLSPHVAKGGETEARRQLSAFLDGDIAQYHKNNNDMALDTTSRLSPYLHFGCLSPLEVESRLPDTEGARAWHRQLAWREFYHSILLHNPTNSEQEFQEKYRQLQWDNNEELLHAWQQGKTGFPIVDAAMRQLRHEGWMHNRGRLIVGSFLTKDLWLDWRQGEAYFMKMLIDGDQANNNGNWQWIASVGVDPAPVYRRLYNPTSQQEKYDSSGMYVRKYVPELANVPDNYLLEPWKMPKKLQKEIGCVIGKDYPVPIVDHKTARVKALERYRAA